MIFDDYLSFNFYSINLFEAFLPFATASRGTMSCYRGNNEASKEQWEMASISETMT